MSNDKKGVTAMMDLNNVESDSFALRLKMKKEMRSEQIGKCLTAA